MAKGVQHVFGDLGEPDAYIKGDEGSGAFIVGLRYGSGWLIRKTARAHDGLLERTLGRLRFRRQRVQMLHPVYNLREDRRLFQRFPGVEGSFYFVAGLGRELRAQRRGDAWRRCARGVGLRAGVNAQYQVYSDRARLVPALTWHRGPQAPATAIALGALALGALAVGALAIGYVAIGRLACETRRNQKTGNRRTGGSPDKPSTRGSLDELSPLAPGPRI